MIDLHCHSTASDGSLSPRALIQLAHETTLDVIALTDHDTIDGLDEAQDEAEKCGIHFISGIEVEVAWTAPGVFHLLGLNFDVKSPELGCLLAKIREARNWRNSMMINRMIEHGLQADLATISSFAGGEVLGRPHFADYLVSIGQVRDRQSAFEHFLRPGKPFFETYPGVSLDEAVRAIHAAKGLVVVAHPLSLYVSWTRLAGLMAEWKAVGVDAVETWHPSASWKDAQRLTKLALAAGLKISAGSDFHGEHRSDRVLGRSLEERHKIDDSFLALFDY